MGPWIRGPIESLPKVDSNSSVCLAYVIGKLEALSGRLRNAMTRKSAQ